MRRKPLTLDISPRPSRLEKVLADVTGALRKPEQDHRALWELDLHS